MRLRHSIQLPKWLRENSILLKSGLQPAIGAQKVMKDHLFLPCFQPPLRCLLSWRELRHLLTSRPATSELSGRYFYPGTCGWCDSRCGAAPSPCSTRRLLRAKVGPDIQINWRLKYNSHPTNQETEVTDGDKLRLLVDKKID